MVHEDIIFPALKEAEAFFVIEPFYDTILIHKSLSVWLACWSCQVLRFGVRPVLSDLPVDAWQILAADPGDLPSLFSLRKHRSTLVPLGIRSQSLVLAGRLAGFPQEMKTMFPVLRLAHILGEVLCRSR